MGELLTIGGNLATIGGLLAVASGGGGTPNPDNTMSLKNVSGSTVTDYPLRFARTFAEGEIANYPQIVIDGTPITTQADVKTQWGDGSVQHCVLSAVVSSMTNNVAMEITFQNQASPNTTALTKAEMLAFDFDSVISKTVGGVTHTASARTMLNAGSYTVWCSGQIATTVIIADHSASAAYDMTWSSVPERPIFHATFWKDLNKVDVSAIGELANAEALGDLSVSSMSITKASASPTTAYTKSSFTLRLASRWIKRFWIGTAPATAVNLDHNLAYLKETGAFPNYDTSIVPLSSALTSVYSDWTGASKDLYDARSVDDLDAYYWRQARHRTDANMAGIVALHRRLPDAGSRARASRPRGCVALALQREHHDEAFASHGYSSLWDWDGASHFSDRQKNDEHPFRVRLRFHPYRGPAKGHWHAWSERLGS
jgi:hypothetical protein